MFVIQLWLIFGLTILGAVARGLPEVDERDNSGSQTYPRGLNEDQSSGKLDCTDCGPQEELLDSVADRPVPGLSAKHHHKSTNGDPSSYTTKKNKKTGSVKRNRKGKHKKGNRKGKSKPVVSKGGITLNTHSDHATRAQDGRENTDTTLKDFKENVQQQTGVNHKKEETRKLAANIQNNIKKLGEISTEIKKLINGNVGHTLTLTAEDSVVKGNAESTVKHEDFHPGKKSLRKHKKKKVDPAEDTNRSNHENSNDRVTKLKGDKHERDEHNVATSVHEIDPGAVLGEKPGDVLGRVPAVADKDGKPGHTDAGKVDDRWSRPGLSQVPDAARLERRLHPTIDAPIRDIMRSLSSMLYRLQGSIHRADYDYHYVFNSTRWTLMVGVRERLKKLVEQNDKVYDTVLQASLLTKEIYRRAHERRRNGTPLSPAAIVSREPVISTVYLRPLHERVLEEVEQARRLKSFITSTIRQRSDLLLEFARVQRRLEERLPTRALQDLERRARQAQGLLQSAHAQRDARDGLNLFRHMYRNLNVNMEAARNMTMSGWEEVMVAKRKSMESKAVAGRIMKRYRDHVPGSGTHTPFDHMRVVLWSKVDIATLHADDLFKAAAEIHMKLEPMLGKAKLVLANYDRDPISKRIQNVADEISSNLKLLRRVLDKITLSLKAEHLVRERCEDLEGEGSGSAGYYDDDMTSLIDCDEYITVQSGDSEEGSGELEGVLVDIDTPTLSNTSLMITGDHPNLEPVDIDITDLTNVSRTTLDETDEFYIDEDLDGKIVLPDETPDDQHKGVDVELNNGTGKAVNESGVKNAILIPGDSDDEDIIKEALRTNAATKTTIKATMAKPTTVKPTTAKPDTVNPAATNNHVPDKPVTVKPATTGPPEVTTKPTEVTTKQSEVTTKGSWWWSKDEPVKDVAMEIEETDVSNLTFNEVLRLRLSTFAISSKAIYENATVIKERSDELSATWDKLQLRFGRYELRTLEARLFTEQWAAEQAVFAAVHDRVQNVINDVILKEEMVKSQSTKAVEKAERKLEQMEARHKSRSEQAGQAADPEVVKEARESAAKFTDDVIKLVQLTRLVPAPCKVVAGLQRHLKANISELRRKIEQAKLIASSLQVPVHLDGSAHLSVPLQHSNQQKTQLGTRLDMVVKVTDSDGPVVAVETKDTGSFALVMKDKTARVVAFDEDKYETEDISTNVQLEEDTWYRIVLDRLARTFNLTVYNATSGELLSHGDAVFDDGDVTVTQSFPTVVHVGGLSDDFSDYGHWSGCVGSLLLDGQTVSLVRKDSAGKLPVACSSERAISYRRSGLILDGSGFARYDLDPMFRSQRAIHSVGITFRPLSAGLVFSLSNRHLGFYVRAALEQDELVVHVQMSRGPVLAAVSKLPIQASHYKLEVHLKGRPKVSIDGRHLVLKTADGQANVGNSASEGLYVGAAPLYNRSLAGCVRSITINKQNILLAGAMEMQGGAFGTCRDRSCVTFAQGSTAIDMVGIKDAVSLLVAFTFGSAGPLVQYVKKEKFDVTVSVDNTTLEVFDAVSDVTENVPLEGYSEGDLVVLTIDDEENKVVTRADAASVSVEYEGGGAWWGGDDDKKDSGSSSYSLALGGSSETEDTFRGQVTEVLINGKSMDLSAHIEENSLGYCKSQNRVVSHWRDKPAPEETFTC